MKVKKTESFLEVAKSDLTEIEGGGLEVAQIKDFLKASYEENPPNQLGEYQLDLELTNLFVKVYFSISNRKVIIIHRGTKEASDWLNNLTYGLNSNAYNFTTRFKISKNTQNKAQKNIKVINLRLLVTRRRVF